MPPRLLLVGVQLGSYSVLEGRQTIGKIIPRKNFVFVGIHESKDPQKRFKAAPLERVNQGVRLYGIWVPIEYPDDAQLAVARCGTQTIATR